MARETPAVTPENAHLLPGFDPSKVTVAVLRGLLLEHHVDFASNAKKAELVALFKRQVAPRANDILRQRLAVQGSSAGIQRVSNKDKTSKRRAQDSDASSDTSSDSEDVVVPHKRRSKEEGSAGMPSKKLKSEEIRDEFKEKKRRRTSGFSDYNAFQDSSPEREEQRKHRKSSLPPPPDMVPDEPARFYAPQPKPAVVASLEVPKIKPRASSPLNPAASSSQPPAALPKSQSMPRLKPYVNVQGLVAPPTEFKRLQKQVAELQPPPAKKERTLSDVMEAFDAQTQQRLSAGDASRRHSAASTVVELAPKPVVASDVNRRKSLPAKSPLARIEASHSGPPTPLRKALVVSKKNTAPPLVNARLIKNATWSTFTVFCLVYFLWWRAERLQFGYCDSNSDSNALLAQRRIQSAPPTSLDLVSPAGVSRQLASATLFRPTCMPCPTHGFCTKGELVACDRDYVRQPNGLTALFGRLLPLPDHCVPDTEKLVRVAEIANLVEKRLRQERGRIVCRGPLGGASSKLGKDLVVTDEARRYGMRVDAVKQEMLPYRNAKLSEAQWEDYFAHAIADLVSHGEALREAESDDEVWVAATQADLPLWCRSQRMAYDYASQRKTELSALLSTLFAIWWIRTAYKQHRQEKIRVRELANLALRALRDQKRRYLHAKGQGQAGIDPFWSLAGMRDHILSAEHNLAIRQRLWKQVAKLVENNDNVRLYEIELEGQPGVRVWDWSGNVTEAFDFDVSPSKQTRFEPVQKVYPSLEE